MSVTYDYTGRTAFVTGGSAGMGKVTVQAFAHAGAHVAIADVDKVSSQRLADELTALGLSALAVQCDVGRVLGDRWGVSDDETSRRYPCDEFVNVPALEVWRAVDIAAPTNAVWPWVTQMRVAPYSYDWIDNMGRRSPRELLRLPEPRVGDNFTSSGGRPLGRIVSVDPGQQLTGTIMGAFMSYVLHPKGDLATRLLLKVVMQTTRFSVALSLGDLVMARRQLLNIKRLAELNSRGGM